MTAIQVGRIVVKTNGREAGKKGVIVDLINENYVLLTGPKTLTSVRRRKCNIRHFEPTDKMITIKRDSTDEEIVTAIDSAKLKKFMEEKIIP